MDRTTRTEHHLPKTSVLYRDYLDHHDRVAQFFNGQPSELASYTRVAQAINSAGPQRPELVEVLTRQNRFFGCAEPTFANIERLRHPGCFVVATGQQVGLFSGPAFTLYKALTAIRVAQTLSERGLPCVPLFWLATDDHDLEEVASTAVFDSQYELERFADPGVTPAPKSPVGWVKLSGAISGELERLASTLSTAGARDQALADLRACYRPGATWGEAFGKFVARFFSRLGVVLVDALDPEIHRLSAPVYESAIGGAAEFRKQLLERSQALVRAGYHAQVHVGPDSTLLFLISEGNRVAVHQHGADGGFFTAEGESLSGSADLLARLPNRAADFSPNALLRPLVQDTLFPTVAYVAGPAELAYHAQTQVLYPSFGRPQPVVVPRAGFTLVDQRTGRLLEKYRLQVEDVWQGDEHLRQRIAAAGFAEGWAERLDQSERDLARLLERLRGDIAVLDPTLLDTLTHSEEKMKYQMERLRSKIARAALARSEVLNRHAQWLLKFFTPRQSLQEREVSGVYFLATHGYELLDRLLAEIDLGSWGHRVMNLSA